MRSRALAGLAFSASVLLPQLAHAEQELFGQFEVSFTEGDAVIVARTRTRYEGRAQIPLYRDTDTGAILGEGQMTVTTSTRGLCSGASTEVEKWTISGRVDGEDISFSPFYEVKTAGTAKMRCRGGSISGAFSTEQPWGVLDVVLHTREGANSQEEALGNGPQRIRYKFTSVCTVPSPAVGPLMLLDPNPRIRWPREYSNRLTKLDLTTIHSCGSVLACDPVEPANRTWVHGLTVYPLEPKQIDLTVKTTPARVGPPGLCYSVSLIKAKLDPLRIYTPLEHAGTDPRRRTCVERALLGHEEQHAAVWDVHGVTYLERWKQSVLADRALPTELRPWRVTDQAEGDRRLRELIESVRRRQIDDFAAAANQVSSRIDTPAAMAALVHSCPERCWQPNAENCE